AWTGRIDEQGPPGVLEEQAPVPVHERLIDVEVLLKCAKQFEPGFRRGNSGEAVEIARDHVESRLGRVPDHGVVDEGQRVVRADRVLAWPRQLSEPPPVE